MAVDTYANLKTEIEKQAARSDTVFTDRIDTFIDLTEALVNGRVRHPSQLAVTTLSTVADTATVAHPSDYVQTQFIEHQTGRREVEYAPLQTIQNESSVEDRGRPKLYYPEYPGSSILLSPTPDDVYVLNFGYYKKVPALSDSNTTNWLLDNFPGVYLHGSLMYAYKFLRNDKKAADMESLMLEEITRINEDAKDRRSGSSGMYMRPHVRSRAGGR